MSLLETQILYLKDLRLRLQLFESGMMQSGEKVYGDKTEHDKAKLRNEIAAVEAQIKKLEADIA